MVAYWYKMDTTGYILIQNGYKWIHIDTKWIQMDTSIYQFKSRNWSETPILLWLSLPIHSYTCTTFMYHHSCCVVDATRLYRCNYPGVASCYACLRPEFFSSVLNHPFVIPLSVSFISLITYVCLRTRCIDVNVTLLAAGRNVLCIDCNGHLVFT